MDRLVECRCGHGAGEHDDGGCFACARSLRGGPCPLTQFQVIEGAVEAARTEYRIRCRMDEDSA